MNYKVINILLLIAVITSVVLFHIKFDGRPTDLDEMDQALQGLRPLLHPSRPLPVEIVPPADEQKYQFSKYLLAPVRTLKAHKGQYDTILFIYPLHSHAADSLLHRSPYSALWQGADTRFSYFYMARKR